MQAATGKKRWRYASRAISPFDPCRIFQRGAAIGRHDNVPHGYVCAFFDVLDILRNTPETANVHVIMLTALSQENDVQRAKDLGVDDYLVKSQVVIAEVVEKIKQHLGMSTV